MSVNSLTLQLQQDALDSRRSVSDLLRKALVVATKLGLTEFKQFIEWELHGYGDESVPPYRCVDTTLLGLDPRRGWVPALMPDEELRKTLCVLHNSQPLGEIETLCQEAGSDRMLHYPLDDSVMIQLQEIYDIPTQFVRAVPRSAPAGILAAVRNKILGWSLSLEAEGILGNDMTFSEEEQTRAEHVTTITINRIDNFQGQLGTVSGGEVLIDGFAQVEKQLADRGIPDADRLELRRLLDELKTAAPAERASVAKRGMEWATKMWSKLGSPLQKAIMAYFTDPPG